MTRVRAVPFTLGAGFGFVLAWTGMSDPDVIRRMLLPEDAYLFLVMSASMATAFLGLRLLRALRLRALLTGDPVSWTTSPPGRRHVAGSVVFGVGWATTLGGRRQRARSRRKRQRSRTASGPSIARTRGTALSGSRRLELATSSTRSAPSG